MSETTRLITPVYYAKFPQTDDRFLRDSEILQFFESLNAADWRELLRDLVTNPSLLSPLLSPKVGEDIVAQSAGYFERLGSPTKRHIARALDALVIESLGSDGEEYTESIRGYFFLAKVLCEGIKPELLTALVRNGALVRDIRQDAAAVLANLSDTLPLDFWFDLDLHNNPFFAPAAVASASQSDPVRAFEILLAMGDVEGREKEDLLNLLSALKYPLRRVLDKLLVEGKDVEAPQKVKRVVEDLSPSLKELVTGLPAYDELIGRRTMPAKLFELIKPKITRRKSWAELVEKVISTRKLPYYYTGYQQANIFLRDNLPELTDIELDYLNAVRDEIKTTAGTPDIEIQLNRLELFDLNRLVEDLLSGQVIMPEVGYGTRSRGEKATLVRVGQIQMLAVLVPQHLCKRFEVSLDINMGSQGNQKKAQKKPANVVQMSYPTLDRVLDFCIDEKIDWIKQPNSSVSEVLGDIFNRKMNEPGRTNLTRSYGGGVENPEWIRNELVGTRRRPKKIALLDHLTAVGIKRHRDSKNLGLYHVRYDEPLPVGYFTPLGDPEFLEHIWNAVHNILFNRQTEAWNPAFENLMEKSLVELDSEPSVQGYSSAETGWISFTVEELSANRAGTG